MRIGEPEAPPACTVRLPSWLVENFESSGTSPSLPGCKRRFPRVRCRSKNRQVVIDLRQSLPALPRTPRRYSVYVVDIGSGGMGLLHGAPLYPLERMNVELPDGKQMAIEVVRCERLDESCFSIGVRFVETAEVQADRSTRQWVSYVGCGSFALGPMNEKMPRRR